MLKQEKLSWKKIVEDAAAKGLPLIDFLWKRNAEAAERTIEELRLRIDAMWSVMEESAEYGLSGVKSASGLTGGAALNLKKSMETAGEAGDLMGKVTGDAVIYAMAVAEANAAMGRIVAAPTAGASGIMPGLLLSLAKNKKVSREKILEGILVGGTIGEVVAERAYIAGASGGCQAECGTAAAMAAGAAVHISGGDGVQIDNAVAIVFKNMLGLVCDPVAGLVEVPCVKRNAGSVVQALLGAQLALAGIRSFIPADEAIDAMKAVGDAMPASLRETAEGGLAISPTAQHWTEEHFNSKATGGGICTGCGGCMK